MQFDIPDVTAMESLAGQIALLVQSPFRIDLQGNLGAGKTTFVRGFLRQLGYPGVVKSPTYTLVEPYTINNGASRQLFHFDLYRLNTADELEDIGLRDYLGQDAISLVEWPERAASLLSPADLVVQIAMSVNSANGRHVELQAHTPQGQDLLRILAGKQ